MMETIGKFLDSANKVAQFIIMWVVGLVTGLVLGIRKCVQKRRQRARQTPGPSESGLKVYCLRPEMRPLEWTSRFILRSFMFFILSLSFLFFSFYPPSYYRRCHYELDYHQYPNHCENIGKSPTPSCTWESLCSVWLLNALTCMKYCSYSQTTILVRLN